VLGWTVTWMILCTVLNVGVGMLLAMMLNNPRLRERNVYRTLLIIPWSMPFILTSQVWAGIYNTQGPLNLILSWFGVDKINWLNSVGPARAALILVNLWLSYPFFMTVCLAALQAIPTELYEVADLDGANSWQRFRAISMEEMHDVERLIKHILYLEGLPNLQRLNQILVGESVLELMQAGLTLEHGAVDHLREAIAHCAQVGDFTTRAIFEEMIRGEEEHVDLFETQLSAINMVGLERYLAQQVHDD
jgi:bacterioferritin